MTKLVMVDGVPHRNRRGKLVEIPEQWFGNFTSKKTIRQRKLKAKNAKRNRVGANIKGCGY